MFDDVKAHHAGCSIVQYQRERIKTHYAIKPAAQFVKHAADKSRCEAMASDTANNARYLSLDSVAFSSNLELDMVESVAKTDHNRALCVVHLSGMPFPMLTHKSPAASTKNDEAVS